MSDTPQTATQVVATVAPDDTVTVTNGDGTTIRVPRVKIIAAVTAFITLMFAAVTYWVLMLSKDPAQIGAVVQTWENVALTSAAMWMGTNAINNLRRHQ